MLTPSFCVPKAYISITRSVGWLLLLSILVTACDSLSAQPSAAASPLSVGSAADGSAARPLTEAVLEGTVYIFTQAEGGVQRASFYLDDEAQRGEPFRQLTAQPVTEGDDTGLSFALDTQTLADGPHVLTLELTVAAGEPVVAHAPFTVGNTAAAMLTLVNDVRRSGYDCGEEGVFGPAPELKLEPHLIAAAQRQAADMDEYDYLEHTGSDGSTIGTRVTDTGYRWSRVGENLAYGQDNVAEVVADWLESDGHCANVLGPDFTEFGAVQVGGYWTQVFGRPQ